MQQTVPNSPNLDTLPKLERELALKQLQLETERRLADITDRENRNEISPSDALDRVNQLRKENDLLIANVANTYRAAEAARTLARAKAESATIVRENSAQADSLRLSAQLRGFGVGTGDRLSMEREASLLDLQSKYAQDKVSLLERSQSEGLTKEQMNSERLRLAIRFSQSSNLNNAQFNRSSKDEAVSNSRYMAQSNIDLLTARSESLQGIGLDYSTKSIQKQIAISSQNLSFSTAIAELERLRESTNLTAEQFAQAKANLDELNQLKLDNISSQFNDFAEVIKGVKSDTTNVFKDFIMNTKDVGQSITAIFESVLNNLSSMASQMLSDQLFSSLLGGGKVGGGSNSGGDFGSILSSIGSLFGSGGGSDYSSSLGGSGSDSFSFLGGFAEGGMVGDIAKSMTKEKALSGRSPRLIVANVGERVLNAEETKLWNRLQNAGQLPSFADGGVVGASGSVRVINGVQSADAGVNIGGITVVVGGGESDVNVPQLQKVLQAQIQKTIKQERRPGGSISKGNPYSR